MNVTVFPSDLERINKLTAKFEKPFFSIDTSQQCNCCNSKLQLALNLDGIAIVTMFHFEISDCLDEIEEDEEAMKIINREEI